MSIYSIKSTDGKDYMYGFFKYNQSYFLSREYGEGRSRYLVGGMSGVPGTWNHLFAALVECECIPPMKKFLELLKSVGPIEAVIGKEVDSDTIDQWLIDVERWNTTGSYPQSERLPVKEESGLYGIVISADGVQAIDFIEGNTIVVKGPLED